MGNPPPRQPMNTVGTSRPRSVRDFPAGVAQELPVRHTIPRGRAAPGTGMMKWFKRLALFVVGLVLVLGLAGVGAYVYGVRATPEWLRRPVATEAERIAAANSADQKILDTLSQVREMEAYAAAGAAPDPADKRPLATQPADKLKVTFTEAELNASFRKWDRLYGWTKRYHNYVQDPSIVLHGGRIIVAGESAEMKTVVSLHFEPKLVPKGKLTLSLDSVLAGRLPLPQAFFEKYRTSARTKLQGALPRLQREAELGKDGSANSEAMAAAMAKLFLRVLANEPGEPVLFLPVGEQRSVPVRLTDVRIEDKELSLTVKPLNAKERVALIERIREPYLDAAALKTDPASPRLRPTGS